jgi:hypothetical protein
MLLRTLPCLIALAAFPPAGSAAADEATSSRRFFDAEDGWLDISGFLDTAYGFRSTRRTA